MKPFIYVVMTSLVLFTTPAQLNAACIRQSMENHDYCGPEGRKITYLVPDRAFGDFTAACAAHDVCYSFGGEAIVSKMESKFRKSMSSATDSEKAQFRSEIESLKTMCDNTFFDELQQSCSSLQMLEGSRCRSAAMLYYKVVGALADSAFYRAVDEAFTCRTR